MSLVTKPFGKILESKSYNIVLDSIYILTLKNRPMPITDFKFLSKYTKEIVLLFSEGSAGWVKELDDSIRIEYVKNKPFCKDYLYKKENKNTSVKWRPDFDIPLKRSFALFDARNRKFKNILLLDDDIEMTESNMQVGLSGLTYNKTIVGFHVVDYPDVSTIDHIERIVMKNVNVISMTGSCMFINVEKIKGDFPLVYNEDLFFFMKQINPQDIVSGGTILQKEYQPWVFEDRVRHEQFGDLIYEAFKKRFLGIDTSSINWEEEIQLRLNRINLIMNETSQEILRKALGIAYKGIGTIKVGDIDSFVTNYEFADWVSKYL